jgi:hypothetical protein
MAKVGSGNKVTFGKRRKGKASKAVNKSKKVKPYRGQGR